MQRSGKELRIATNRSRGATVINVFIRQSVCVCVCLLRVCMCACVWVERPRLTFRSRVSPADQVSCRGHRAHDDRRSHRYPRRLGADACGTSGATSGRRVWHVHGRESGVCDGRMHAESATDALYGVQLAPAGGSVLHRQIASPRPGGAGNGCCKTGGL